MADDETALVELAEAVGASGHAFMTALGPIILASRALEIASDTRSVARLFDVAHALVIRECRHLEEDLGLLTITDKGERSARLFFDLTPEAQALVSAESAA